MSKKISVGRSLSILILTLWAISALLPFLWMISTSLKDSEVIRTIPIQWIPRNPGFSGYEEIFNLNLIPFGAAIKNTIIVSVIIVFVTVMFPAMAAFIFAKVPFKGSDKVFMLFLTSMMIPGVVTIIPNFIIMITLGLMGTFTGVALPYFINAFGIFLIRQAMKGVDNAYMEAALMDGASLTKIFWKVMLPMVRPTLMTLVLLQFMFAWNNYLWPAVVLGMERSKWTLSIALANMQTAYSNDDHILMAGSLMIMAPMIVIYLITQKYVQTGIMVGGIKG